MFEKVLYPTDFSKVSKKALGSITKLKSAGLNQVVVLRIME